MTIVLKSQLLTNYADGQATGSITAAKHRDLVDSVYGHTGEGIASRLPLVGAASTTGTKTLGSAAVAEVPVIAKGFAGQTGDLTQWQSDTGAILAAITAQGFLLLPGGLRFRGFTTAAGAATTTQVPNDKDVVVHKDTSATPSLKLVINDGGVLKSVTFA